MKEITKEQKIEILETCKQRVIDPNFPIGICSNLEILLRPYNEGREIALVDDIQEVFPDFTYENAERFVAKVNNDNLGYWWKTMVLRNRKYSKDHEYRIYFLNWMIKRIKNNHDKTN
jgi:hypothetical protein